MNDAQKTRRIRGMLTIPDALGRSCRWFARRAAIIEGDREISYDGFAAAMRRISRGYAALGLRKGERIAFLCSASANHALAFYAAHQLGAITVNLHLRETAAYQIRLIDRLRPRLLVYDAERTELAQQLADNCRELRLVSIGSNNRKDPSLEELLAESDEETCAEVSEGDPAIIQLSSGSTGTPKALVHTHASVLESWTGGLYMWSGISPDDCFLNAFSPSFVVWLVHPGSFLVHGAAVVMMGRWDALSFLEAVPARRITCTALTPTQWRSVLAAGAERHDLHSLRMAAYLGEKMAAERLQELTERVCASFCSFYGMSECLGLGGCVIRSSDFIEKGKWGSVGKPCINSDLRIADVGADAVKEKAPGQMGEVVVRAASFVAFNWGDPGWQDRVVTADGWYRTGDLGYVDDEGYVYLGGRVDNQIATGGIKVSAEEIEQVLGGHPNVAAAAVIGIEDAKWGQRIAALVVARHPGLRPEELDAWCRSEDRLAGFKRPREWHFVDALPVTSVGKLDRKSLHRLLPAAGEIVAKESSTE